MKLNTTNKIGVCGIFILTSILLCYSSLDIQLYMSILISLLWIIIIPTVTIFNIKLNKNLLLLVTFLIITITVYNINLLNKTIGSLHLFSIMAIAWIVDIGGYFIGKKFGKHQLASKISPNKTIEGAIGGLILVIIYFFILKYLNFAFYINNYFSAINLAIIFVAYSILGDLFESYLKRITNIKDSGNILPGHGGIFDRIDSLVAVLAIANLIIM
jgi:phosphatidate cytidylyltransferase